MPLTLSISAVGETVATLNFGALAADGVIEVQLGARPDFQFCVCPIFAVARAAQYQVQGLNQRATYFARCRSRRASGAADDWSGVQAFRTGDGAARDLRPGAVLIEPALIVTPEPVLEWQAGSAVAGFPVSNLGIDAPVGWKSISAGQLDYVDARLAGAAIDTVALLQTNLPEAAQVDIIAAPTRAALDDVAQRNVIAAGAPFRASSALPGRPGYHGLFRFDPVQMPWWRLRLLGAKPGGVLWAEHLIFGRNRVTKNHSVDKTETPIPRSSVERQRSGIPDRTAGIPMRKVEFDISMLTEAQYEEAYGDLGRFENEAVLVVPNSKAGAFLHDRILYGDLRNSRIFNPASPRFTRSFSIESLI
ncbi:MAG: hypothetical protein K2X76_15310 [Sphingomonas sp.]|nr:hypothetical protein [Sphingomonas sp.]